MDKGWSRQNQTQQETESSAQPYVQIIASERNASNKYKNMLVWGSGVREFEQISTKRTNRVLSTYTRLRSTCTGQGSWVKVGQ